MSQATPKSTPAATRNTAAVAMLQSQGYTWFPGAAKWEQFPGLPFDELRGVPGWYRCAQVKAMTKEVRSFDGYTLVTKDGAVVHFDLSLRERKWAPSIGYENQVCFVPVDMCEALNPANNG